MIYAIGGLTKLRFEIQPSRVLRVSTVDLILHSRVIGSRTQKSTEVPRCLHTFFKDSLRMQAQVEVIYIFASCFVTSSAWKAFYVNLELALVFNEL